MNGNKWFVTTVVAIAAASISTFVSVSWSLAENETRIELAYKQIESHSRNMSVHVDRDTELSTESRLARIETLLETAIDRLDKLSDNADIR